MRSSLGRWFDSGSKEVPAAFAAPQQTHSYRPKSATRVLSSRQAPAPASRGARAHALRRLAVRRVAPALPRRRATSRAPSTFILTRRCRSGSGSGSRSRSRSSARALPPRLCSPSTDALPNRRAKRICPWQALEADRHTGHHTGHGQPWHPSRKPSTSVSVSCSAFAEDDHCQLSLPLAVSLAASPPPPHPHPRPSPHPYTARSLCLSKGSEIDRPIRRQKTLFQSGLIYLWVRTATLRFFQAIANRALASRQRKRAADDLERT